MEKGERQRGGLTPRDSRKNSEVAKIPGTFEECISVAATGTWPHDAAIEFVRQWPPDVSVLLLQPTARKHSSPAEKHAHGRRAGLSDVPGLGDLNDLAASYIPRNLNPPRTTRSGFPFYSRISESLPTRPVNFARRKPARLYMKWTILLRDLNFAGYRSENNFVGLSKFCWNLKNNELTMLQKFLID